MKKYKNLISVILSLFFITISLFFITTTNKIIKKEEIIPKKVIEKNNFKEIIIEEDSLELNPVVIENNGVLNLTEVKNKNEKYLIEIGGNNCLDKFVFHSRSTCK